MLTEPGAACRPRRADPLGKVTSDNHVPSIVSSCSGSMSVTVGHLSPAHQTQRMETPRQPDCTIETPPGAPGHQDELLDEALKESFPASDPVSITIDKHPDDPPRDPVG